MDIHPSISVKNRESGERNTYRMEQESVILGRDHTSFIILPSKRISRNHAEIRFENGSFFIVDLESGNGTYLNSQRLAPKEKMLLKSSDKIRIENFDIVFRVNGEGHHDFGDVTDTDILEIKMIKKLLQAVDKENAPVLEVVGGDATGKRFVLDGKNQEVVVGRDPACEFQIESEVISRKHARVVKKWDTITIIDLASKNGVYVNDERISEQMLSDGDRILLGTLPLLYRNPTEHGFDYLAASAPAPRKSQEEEILISRQAKPFGEEPSGLARVARRADQSGTESKEASPLKKAPPPQPIPEVPQESGLGEVAPPPPGMEPLEAETKAPFWQRFSPMEIGAALVGLIILLGSIWLLLKLL